MTLLGYKGVVIPETVNEITGQTYKYYVDITLVIGLVFAFIAFVAALVSINKIIPGKQGNNPSIIAPSLAGISMLLLLLVLGLHAFIFVNIIRAFSSRSISYLKFIGSGIHFDKL